MSRIPRVLIVLGVLIAAPSVPLAGQPSPSLRQAGSAPAVQGRRSPAYSLSLIAGPRVSLAAIERLYNDAILKDGGIERLVEQLTAAGADRTKGRRYRANASLVRSHVQWRHGSLATALTSADEGLAIEEYDDFAYYKARLLDAFGRTDQAREWFQKALALTTSAQLKETIGLRLTFLDAIDSNVKGLVELARTRPLAFRNRAAIALGILDFNKEALELYQVSGTGLDRFRDELRVAQWAIKAADAPKAQEHAWQAVQAATADRDRRYALSVLAEAHQLDGSAPALIDRLGRQAALTRDEQRLRVELLSQSGQYDKAIALFASAHGGELTPELRQELLRMYRDAGQDAAMIAEYRGLIAREPATAAWAEGLSQYYLEQGDQPGARRVWTEYVERNTDVPALLAGADAMTNFGLHDLAMGAVEKALAHAGDPETAARVRLDQFELYRRRGRNVEAEAALTALDGLLPADSAYRAELADAYERIQKPHLAAKTLEGLSAGKGGLSLDEKMRLAWLLDSVGRRDDALKIWRDLWNTETLAARRKLVAERLLLLAAELGTLGDLAVELEEKLAAGTAEPRDVTLLINLYTKVGDSVSAVETISAAAAAGGRNARSEIETLKEQAQVYLSMAEYQDFARVTRRLLQIDPANRVDYLQQLLLNQIEQGADTSRRQRDETAQLRAYLDQLRDVGGDAVGTEFEAGVLELAGFRDLAVDGYRRALARDPGRADDYLLLADLLRQAGRQAEAVASLQYIAEGAGTDELFLIAIDGITNMRTGGAAVFKWAERRALERLATADDKIYLYEMLADLAEEARDPKMYVAALENSLAHADSRRSYVLRELLAATAEVTSIAMASQRTVQPDPKVHVAYARRLIALGEELPPDVFMDLGRTFIRMDDAAGAKRAFRLAFDTTNDPSMVLEAGKLFERGGFEREAIGEYERALIATSGSVETMIRLARMRNLMGATGPANELYGRALMDVITRQTRAVPRGSERTPPPMTTLVTFEYRKYFQLLLTGFLSTLPAPGPERDAKVRALEQALHDELRQVAADAAGPLAPLAYYPRLTAVTQAVRTAAFAAGQVAVADRADAALLAQFAADPQVAAQAADERARWGFAPGAAAAGSTGTRTMEPSDYMTAIGVALNSNDQEAALGQYRQWLRIAGQSRPPVMIGTVSFVERWPGIQEVLAHAAQRLDERRFASLAQHLLGLVTDQDAYAERLLADLYTSSEPMDVPILDRVEKAIGQPIIAEERLLGLVTKQRSWVTLNLPFVLARVSPARQLDLLERFVTAEQALNWSKLFTSLNVVLTRPLDADQTARLLGFLKPGIQAGIKRLTSLAILNSLASYPLTTGMDAANAPIVVELEQFLAETYPQAYVPGRLKAGMLRDLGRHPEAVAAFLDAALRMYAPTPTPNESGIIMISSASGLPTYYTYQSYVRTLAPYLFPAHRAEVLRVLDEKERELGVTEALISLRLELHNNDPASDQQQFLATMARLVDRAPANEYLLNTLVPMFDLAGQTLKAIDLLTRLTELRPENRTYRFRLVQLWQKVDYPEKAAAAAGGSTLDELNPVPPRPASSVLVSSIAGPPMQRFSALRRSVEALQAGMKGGDPKQAAIGLRTLLLMLPPASMSTTEFSLSRDTEDPYLYFRDLYNLMDTAAPRPGAPATAGGTMSVMTTSTGVVITRSAAPPPPPPPPPPPGMGGAAPPATAGTTTAPPAPAGRGAAPPSTGRGAPPPSTGRDATTPVPTGLYDRLVTSLESTTGPNLTVTRPPRLMDAVVKHPWSVAELEAYVGMLRATDVEKQYVFVDWLISAYVNNGRADAELARREAAVLAGSAGRIDVAIWLGIASRQPQAKAAGLAGRVDASPLAAGPLSGYPRLLLARLNAVAGRRDKAVEHYVGVAGEVLAGAASATTSSSLIADAYGRDNQLMLFTGIGLFDEVREHLDATGVSQVMTAMLGFTRPTGSPALDQSFARFVIVLNARARDAGLTIQPLHDAAGALPVVEAWARAETLQAAASRAQVGRIDDALRVLQMTLRRDLDTRPIFMTSVSTIVTRQYQIALGLVGDTTILGPLAPTPLGIEEFKAVFPATARAWPGARDWVAGAARALPGWVAEGSVSRDAAVQLLSLLTLRLQQMGDAPAAQASAGQLTGLLRAGPVTIRSASLAMTAADKVGAPVDLALLQDLVRGNQLHVSRVVTVLARTVEAEGAGKALDLGAVAAQFTSADELLRQLIAIARAANDTAEVQRWTTRQREASAARTQLMRRPPGR